MDPAGILPLAPFNGFVQLRDTGILLKRDVLSWDIYLDLCWEECNISVMKDRVISLSYVMFVKAIIMTAICILSKAMAKSLQDFSKWNSLL